MKSKYFDKLCDPVDRSPLRLRSDGLLEATESGAVYGFRGPFPDLRHGPTRAQPVPPASDRAETEVIDHYDEKPCHNFLDLDNVPLGRYLREREYDRLFAGVEFPVEVGCGKGAIARALQQHRGIVPLCIDQAYGSLRHVRTAPLCADGVLGSNLCLPVASGTADLVISYGVIHHTPDPMRCFAELVRILKQGGRLLLGVYNWENPYRSLYFGFSPWLKALPSLLGRRAGNAVLKATAFPPYYLAQWAILASAQRRWGAPPVGVSYEQFADLFLTPIARFYHARELQTLAEVFGLRLLEQTTGGWPRNDFAHFAWFEKP